ncbi:hypothetical protein U5922_000910 (plasmid) [Aquicoccus sp. G2-2]|uniref:hypothetical protein n=1 Tax=Aquicoccus sp. G2-2 TaxID=3092120 RepID=UPI002AE05F5B|nr:hypothetical protein [Aquicoccus sp. G2-2]MEA1112089.1 hypothetical protein [Aquicoccus sp. G2-2]
MGHLDEADPDELTRQSRDRKTAFPRFNEFGGCCGTGFVHLEKHRQGDIRRMSAALPAQKDRPFGL